MLDSCLIWAAQGFEADLEACAEQKDPGRGKIHHEIRHDDYLSDCLVL